jgi:hypothetical protein
VVSSALGQAGERRQFVYALTINTHLPMPPLPVTPEVQALCQRNGLPDAACQLVQAQGRLLADVAAQLATAPDRVSLVVIVGDHAPPFGDFRNRRVFSQTQVPVWRLFRQ